jgi:hypothetical protein
VATLLALAAALATGWIGCGDEPDESAKVPQDEQVVETVGRYLGAITLGNSRAVCAEFAAPLRRELERRGGAACAKLYAAAGVRPDADAPGAIKLPTGAITRARVRIEGSRASIGGIRLRRSWGRWWIVAGPPDTVARRVLS